MLRQLAKIWNLMLKTLLSDIFSKFSCGIYERRPQICRDFQPEAAVCGSVRGEALGLLRQLEG
jgi:hypothetical protein